MLPALDRTDASSTAAPSRVGHVAANRKPDARVVYAVFDRFPAPKGAAIHIGAFASALGRAFGAVELLTAADPSATSTAAIPGVTHTPLPATGRTVLDRAMSFRAQIAHWRQRRKFPVIHFRSIFEGYPFARYKSQSAQRLVFEVNGLPSIELKYHYPAVADDRELLQKLRAQERMCIEAADLIVTVSEVTAGHLVSRGADRFRIRVIPNGVDTSLFSYAPPTAWSGREIRLLYSGTLASWQGVDRAIEVVALLRRDRPATLTLVGPASKPRKEDLRRLSESLNVAEHVTLLDPLPQEELADLYHAHDVALCPLLRNDRNVVQGCCPLKVLEAMAAGTVLVASDLPVVQALAARESEAILVRPGSAKAIKDAVLRLDADPALADRLSAAARAKVESSFTWEIAGRALIDAYQSVLGVRARSH